MASITKVKPPEIAPVEAPKRIELPWLDGIRGLAALTVAISHCFVIANNDENLSWTWPAAVCGAFAVAVFIFLSGFCLGLPTINQGLTMGGIKGYYKYIEKRCNRILPGYYAALVWGLVIAIFVTHKFTWTQVIGYDPQFIHPLMMMHDWLGNDPMYNGPLWTLPVEFHIYFFLPLFLWLMRRYGTGKGTLISVLATCAVASFMGGTSTSFCYYAVFAVGVYASWFLTTPQPDMPHQKYFGYLAISAIVITVGLAFMDRLTDFGNNRGIYAIVWSGCGLAGFVWIQSVDGQKVRDFLTSPRIKYLGSISYSLYLTHFPIESTLAHFLVPHIGMLPSALVMIVVTVPVSLVFARGFWWLFERPYFLARRKWQNQGVLIP